VILVLTNADTEILSLRAVLEGLPAGFPPVRAANPAALEQPPDLDGVQVVLVRLLGGRRAWERPFDDLRRACIERDVPLLAFGGEIVPDAELAAASTVPPAVGAGAFEYLARGGLANLEHLLRFVADRLLGTAFGCAPPEDVPAWGIWGEPALDQARTTIGVVFYRAHVLSGNTQFVDDLCAASIAPAPTRYRCSATRCAPTSTARCPRSRHWQNTASIP
jgi:cobaltochelatase CobN